MMDLNLVSAPKFVDGVDQNEHFEFGLIGWQWWADGLLAILRVWQQKVENYVQKEKSHGCAENVIEILSYTLLVSKKLSNIDSWSETDIKI